MLRNDHATTSPWLSSALLAGLWLASACVDEPTEPMASDEPMASTSAGDDDDTGTSTGEPDPPAGADSTGEEGGSTGGGLDVDALYDCEEPDFQVIQPLSGPGIDPETGALLEPLQDDYVLHTTQILVMPDQLEPFFALNMPIFEQLAQTDGLIGFALATEPTCGFSRTMGVWRDEQSLLAFVGSGAHAQAMARAREVSITGRTTSWVVTADQLPLTWEMALAAIAEVEPSPVYD